MSEQGWRGFLGVEGLDDWVVLHGGAAAVFRVVSLAEAVREAGRVTSGLVESDGPSLDPVDPADPDTSIHPVHQSKRLNDERQRRRAHLRLVEDDAPGE